MIRTEQKRYKAVKLKLNAISRFSRPCHVPPRRIPVNEGISLLRNHAHNSCNAYLTIAP